MSQPRPRPCIVCGRRVLGGAARCDLHKVGSGRPRPCLVCGRPSQGNYCQEHDPKADEDLRNLLHPYRIKYRSPELVRNRQHRFERAHGRCESCGIVLQQGDWQLDHLVPLSKGGDNTIGNLRVLCKPCHRRKTRQDRKT